MGKPRKKSQAEHERDEVRHACEMLGFPTEQPLTADQADRVKAFVWKLRKHREQELRAAAKDPSLLGSSLPRAQRADQSAPESRPEQILLWAMNQRSLLIGEFQPQFRVGPYFLDFGFPAVKLGIEVDGRDYHTSPGDQARDRRRTDYLAKLGWTVMRFTASDVTRNSMTVADKIARAVGRMQAEQGRKEPWDRPPTGPTAPEAAQQEQAGNRGSGMKRRRPKLNPQRHAPIHPRSCRCRGTGFVYPDGVPDQARPRVMRCPGELQTSAPAVPASPTLPVIDNASRAAGEREDAT